jgi:hypothetical protein
MCKEEKILSVEEVLFDIIVKVRSNYGRTYYEIADLNSPF